MSFTQARPAPDLATLRAAVRGRVVEPGDPDFDRLRTLLYAGPDLRPAALVRVTGPADVAATIAFARERGLELAIRAGGHSAAAHSTTGGGLVVDVRELDGIELADDLATAWIGAGQTAGGVTSLLAGHDRAIPFGDTGSVGVAGITLGGGIGYLVRKHGLTIDSLLAAEIVTADGTVRMIDAENEPDLFWAIRGGGGNFGVATRFRFRLAELPGVVGGMLVLPATAETVAGFIAAAEAAPDELSGIANVMPAPPMPFLPAEVHGRLVILSVLCYAGGVEDGQRALAPFRALATPIADLTRPSGYPELYPPDDPDYHPSAVARTLFLERVDLGVAGLIVDTLQRSDAAVRVAQLRVLGGAAARVPTDATAYAHRASRIMVNVAAFYEGDEDLARRTAWVSEFAGALRQADGGAYVNFLADEGPERVRAAYPGATWDRLVDVKTRYDPQNVFHRNQNIPPR